MTELSDLLPLENLEGVPTWRAYLSIICVLLGSFGVVFGVLGASTNIWMMLFDWSYQLSWEAAGISGGFGAFLLLASIPYATPRVNSRVLELIEVGAVFVFIALLIFTYQYPQNWNIFAWDTIALTGVMYLIGLAFGLSAALRAVIGFKVRQSPGGKVKMIVEQDGDEVTARVDESTLRNDPHFALKYAVEDMGDVGAVGLIGGRPDEYVETQTNRPDKTNSDD